MTVEELKKIVKPYIDLPFKCFKVKKQMFSNKNGRKLFNRKIRENVEKKFGVYFWVENSTNEIIYIGKAGKINKEGIFDPSSKFSAKK
jgi:hypothetical protein